MALRPDHTGARENLLAVLLALGELSRAEQLCRDGIRLGCESLYFGLGQVLCSMGRVEEAIAAYSKLPNHQHAFSNTLLCLHYRQRPPEELFRRHLDWAAKFYPEEDNKATSLPTASVTSKVRIGYVSGDFRRHSVAYFIEPILYFHDKERFEVYCYSDVEVPDDVTARHKGLISNWRNINGKNDDDVVAQIQDDGIHILVDLGAHTGTRLGVFAKKPAPVQVTYLGYGDTTGLKTIDYRLADGFTDPEGQDRFYSEKIIRLPDSCHCFAPPGNAPDISPPPYVSKGTITFGCFNNIAKISDELISAWHDILEGVDNSVLILKNRALGDASVRQWLLNRFERAGVASERIVLMGYEKSLPCHLGVYQLIDIALDSYPHNGVTTSCEALWMGVPVISVKGNGFTQRTGYSILSNLGLGEFVGDDLDGYVRKAVALAGSPQLITQLRGSLRTLMSPSPLCDGERFTGTLEKAYMDMIAKAKS